jgi:hypothetical protein
MLVGGVTLCPELVAMAGVYQLDWWPLAGTVWGNPSWVYAKVAAVFEASHSAQGPCL